MGNGAAGDGSGVRLRRAEAHDGDAIRAVVFEVLSEFGFHPNLADREADLVDVEATYTKPGGAFWVLERADGTIVGTAGLRRTLDGACELCRMYLLPDARGQGLGRAMLVAAIEEARRLGFRCVELKTNSRLQRAIALYRGYGFEMVAPSLADAVLDVALTLKLGPAC